MIRFACTCMNHVFEMPDDSAGTQLQCPVCGRLNDVPTLSDLAAMSPDGTYKVETPQDRLERDRLAKLQRAFSRNRVDDLGNEIDMRLSEDDLAGIGADEVPLELKDQVRPGAPKYDPVTGELVRPLGLKDERPHIDPGTIPMAQRVITYASGETAFVFSAGRIIPELFRFANLTVMFVIFCTHAVLQLMLFPMMLGFLLLAPFFLLLICLVMAHYAIIPNDIGPENNDELPRPLRNLEIRDDLWLPFVHFVLAMALSYGWVFFALGMSQRASIAFVGAMLVIGTILFPAVFLTLTCSGSLLNLRPDRVLGVMAQCGGQYILLIIGWAAAGFIYLLGIVGTNLQLLRMFNMPLPWFLDLPVLLVYPVLTIGIFLMHGFCWHVGLQYRFHHQAFPWIYEFHGRDQSQLSQRRAAKSSLPDPGSAPQPRQRLRSGR